MHPLLITVLIWLPWLVILLLAWRLHHRRPPAWRKVYVSRQGRGNRADAWYWASVHDGRETWITDEELLAGKTRASGLALHPHVYE